jgi:hypothetical protein
VYLGVVASAPSGVPIVFIEKGPAAIGGGLGEGGGLGAVLAEINDFVSVRTGTYAGSIYQYTDTNTWTRRELVAPGQIGKDYTELYMTALADIAAIPNIKNSSNSFAMLFANIISTLYLQIQNGGAIIGGDRYNNDGTDKSTASSAKGFWIGAGGDLKAANATLSQINITAGGTAAEFFDLLKKGSLLRVLAAGIRLYLPKSLTNLSDVNIVEGSVPAIIEPSDYPGTVTPGMWLRHHKGSTFYNTEIASIAGKSFGADSGYVKFGNGLLIQWGASYAPGASGANNMEFSFPLAFSDTNYIITTTYATPDLPTNTNNMYGNVRYSTKTTQKIVVKIYGENRIYWMAIGKG